MRAHTEESAAPFPSALTFINLINASGVFVAALNAVISTNTNKCDRSVSGLERERYICGIHLFLLSQHTQALWHWTVPTWKPAPVTTVCSMTRNTSHTHTHTFSPAVNKPTLGNWWHRQFASPSKMCIYLRALPVCIRTHEWSLNVDHRQRIYFTMHM